MPGRLDFTNKNSGVYQVEPHGIPVLHGTLVAEYAC